MAEEFTEDKLLEFGRKVSAETREAVKAELTAERERVAEFNQRRTAANTNAEAIRSNPLADMVIPLIADPLRQINFKADNAADKAEFYTMNPHLGRFRGEIEEIIEATRKAGQPWTRQTAFEWFKGRNYEKFQADDSATRKAQEDAALRAGLTVGPGGISRSDGNSIGSLDEFKKLPMAEQEKRLEGITF